MKVTKAQAQANRARIVETAAALFRERGYDGVGVADLMAAAGFTHGGFYKHFRSKADLIAEAAATGMSQSIAAKDNIDVAQFVKHYVSREHRDDPGTGCTMAALCADAARQSKDVKATFAAGIEDLLAKFELAESAQDNTEKQHQRAKRLDMFAHVIGAIMLSRACPDDSALANEILNVCRAEILATLPPSAQE